MLEIFELVESATTSLVNVASTVNVYFMVARKVDESEQDKAKKKKKNRKNKKHSK